jgi:hypothetical protein
MSETQKRRIIDFAFNAFVVATVPPTLVAILFSFFSSL